MPLRQQLAGGERIVVASVGLHRRTGHNDRTRCALYGRALCIDRRTDRERIDDRSKHTHTVARHTIQPFGRACHASEYVATAHDDSHLNAHIADLADLRGVVVEACRVDALLGASRERLAAELE